MSIEYPNILKQKKKKNNGALHHSYMCKKNTWVHSVEYSDIKLVMGFLPLNFIASANVISQIDLVEIYNGMFGYQASIGLLLAIILISIGFCNC